MILNAGLNVIIPDVAVLVLYSIVTMTAAIPLFEKAMTRCSASWRYPHEVIG